MNVIKQELKTNRRSFLIWLTVIIALFLIVALVYPQISVSQLDMQKMLQMFPEGMLKSFNFDIADISTFFGWFKSEGLILLMLISCCYAVMSAANALTYEVENHTIFFLLAMPIKRRNLYGQKLIAGLIQIILMQTLIGIFLLVAFKNSKGAFDINQYLLLMLGVLFLNIFFYIIVYALSLGFKKTRSVTGLGLALVISSYMLALIGDMSDKVALLKQISPFAFFSSRYLILHQRFDYFNVFIALFISVICIVVGLIFFERKAFSD